MVAMYNQTADSDANTKYDATLHACCFCREGMVTGSLCCCVCGRAEPYKEAYDIDSELSCVQRLWQ